ncbi:MAG TPA: pyridoxal phosphate-dependent aminotransferase [Candidatus Dormibacteraeota bacterium]|nr:pyridoxal phosphate-dependent aminotransferase [Candidatus Dormibacteraeota bacterium]
MRLGRAGEVELERWFAAHGAPPRIDLARSGAAPLSVAALLALAGPGAVDEYLGLSLDYGDGRGGERLRAAVAAAGAARRPAEVVITQGAVEAILLACAAVAGPGDTVVVGTPAYAGMLRAPEAAGASVVEVPVWRPGSSRLDLGPLLARLPDRTRAVLVNSPHNPTGAAVDPAELEALAARCAAAGATLIVDEVARGTLDPAAPSLTASPAFADGAVVAIGDVSKAFGLGGLRVGWLTGARPALLDRVAALKDLTTLGTPAPSELLAALALENRGALAPRVAAVAGANLDLLARWTAGVPGAELTAPRDGLVAFPRLPDEIAAPMRLERLRRRAGVAAVPGALFGVPGRVRLALGGRPAHLAEALTAMAAGC